MSEEKKGARISSPAVQQRWKSKAKGNRMNQKRIFLSVLLIVTGSSGLVRGQSEGRSQQSKLEVGGQITVLPIEDPQSLNDLFPRREVGIGGRLSYNLNSHFALEAEVNFFPRNYRQVRTNFTGGRLTEGLFGVKAGIRKNKFGIFGKTRPGFMSSSRAVIAHFPTGDGPDRQNPFGFEDMLATQFALDLGGVFELSPSRRTILRFDVGDTIVRYPGIPFIRFPEGTLNEKSLYTHKVQFSAGFALRFK
jgi:hypothetical protein